MPTQVTTSTARDSRPAAGPRRAASAVLIQHWPAVVFVLFLLVVWQAATSVFRPSKLVLPTPGDVWTSFIDSRSVIASAIWPTTAEIVIGFALSVIFGLVIGTLITWSKGFERTTYPTLVAAQIVPKVALAPLFLIWFGYGLTSKIAVAFTIAFFPIVINTVIGLRSIDKELVMLARSTGASRWKVFRKVTFVGALPAIFAGFEIAITLAVIGAIVAEFINANDGLGYLILVANGQLQTDLLFAVLIVLTLLGCVLFALVVLLKVAIVPKPLRRKGTVEALS